MPRKYIGGLIGASPLISTNFDVRYLVVAGGGAGGKGEGNAGGDGAGGGGAGGLLTGTIEILGNTNYTVTVGEGGSAPANTYGAVGGQGSSSVFSSVSTVGGGYGGSDGETVDDSAASGGDGGSGGGCAHMYGLSTSATVGSRTVGQGNNGGLNASRCGGGGGGAGGVGQAGTAGAGGAGVSSDITGSSLFYAGGGGGGSAGTSGTAGAGGSSVGGTGGYRNTGAPTSGTANRGAGGGGGSGHGSGGTSTYVGAAGGDGVVILRYPASKTISVSAGLIFSTSTVGSDKVTTFTRGTGTVSFS